MLDNTKYGLNWKDLVKRKFQAGVASYELEGFDLPG
jgi:hypothetical protein